MIVLGLFRKLPRRYIAAPRIHWGASVEIDVTTYETDEPEALPFAGEHGNGGGTATAVWAPARPTLAITADLPAQDEYEVRVYDSKHGRRQSPQPAGGGTADVSPRP